MDNNPHLILIGGSAGGLEAILPIVDALPAQTSAAVVIAIHAAETRNLPSIITRHAKIPVRVIKDGDPIERGVIHICEGGAQTSINETTFSVTTGRDGRRFTPSIDLLFETAAKAFQKRATAVVVSGMLDDGVIGAQALHEFGSTMLVQEPTEARYRSMPSAVIREDHPDEVMTSEEIGRRLRYLLGAIET